MTSRGAAQAGLKILSLLTGNGEGGETVAPCWSNWMSSELDVEVGLVGLSFIAVEIHLYLT